MFLLCEISASFAYFSIDLVIFLWILYAKTMSTLGVANVFSHFVTYLFTFKASFIASPDIHFYTLQILTFYEKVQDIDEIVAMSMQTDGNFKHI